MAQEILYVGNDGTITLPSLTKVSDGSLVTGASVTGVLKDGAGATVTGWSSIALSDQGSGNYAASISASNIPPVGQYTFIVTATKSGMQYQRYFAIVVENFNG